MKKICFLILFTFFILSNTSFAQLGCKLDSIRSVFTKAGCTELSDCITGCSMYFFNPLSLTGDEAQAFAQKYGANLISIQDAKENQCIVNDLNVHGFSGTIWIGLGRDLTDPAPIKKFVWYDKSPLIYTNWNAGEPNNYGGNENCVQIFANGLWNDFPCSSGNSRSIIEVSLCPETVAKTTASTICPGDSATISLSTVLGAFPYTYKWISKPAGFTSTLNNPVVKPLVTTTYYVIGADRYGCLFGDSITINVKPVTKPTITLNKAVICTGDSVTLSASASNSYLWSTGQTTSSIVVHTAGKYFVKITDLDGCTDTSSTIKVSISKPPIAAFTALSACSKKETKFVDSSSVGADSIVMWAWDFGDGSAPNFIKSPSYTYSTGGNYKVILSVKNNAGCIDTVQKTIRINATPPIDFKYTTVCKGDTTTFTGISSPATDSIANWTWNFGDSKTDLAQNPKHIFASAGNYTTSLIIITVNGCDNKLVKTVTVKEKPLANFTKNSACEGTPVLFQDASITSGNIIQSWLWDFGDGSPVNNTQNPSHLYPTTSSTFSVHLLVTTNLGCSDSVVRTIDIHPKPLVNFTTDDTVGCKKLCVNFKDQSAIASGINAKWRWEFGDATVKSDLKNPVHCYENTSHLISTQYTVTLTVTSDSGCVSSRIKKDFIKLNPNPESVFSVDPQTAYLINPVISFTNLSTGANSWDWYFGDTVTSTLQNPFPHEYADTGTYIIKLVVFSASNCTDTSYQTITIEPDFSFYIPSSFTPNDDGLNDTFTGKGIFNNSYKMVIYNRWGEVVYKTDDIKKPWDGTTKGGKQALEDTYVYHISLKDIHRKAHIYRGIVTLTR
ncbi:MAG: PKD domain-containing protein [Bacteroidia bacterium]